MRRTLLALALVALAACGGDDDPVSTGTTSTTTEAAAAPIGGTDDAAFPVTVEHTFGETTLDAAPERVVVVGFNDQDFVLAFGVEPVAVRYWYGDEDDAVQPWADEYVTGDEPEVLQMDTLNYEAIAALRPDLIVAVYSGITEEEYGLLTQVAPTLAQPAGYNDYGVPWQDVTRSVGAILGQADRAEEIVADLEGRIADLVATHPEWQGLEIAVATAGDGQLSFFAPQDPRSRFFTQLGFVVPDELGEIAGAEFYGELSFEQADLLDRDVLVWDQLSFVPGGRETIENHPLAGGIAAMREGRAIFLEDVTETAFGWNTVLSIPVALDGIVPLLEGAVPAG